MNTIFNAGVSGMVAFQKDLDNTANNIANINTNGFKPSRANFRELVRTEMDVNAETDDLAGSGVKLADYSLDLGQGAVIPTGSSTDFAIIGEGYFAVDNNGVTEYSRNGAFRISNEDGDPKLVNEDGFAVLDADGSAIEIEFDKKTGAPDYSKLKDSVGVFLFNNPYGLGRSKSGNFVETELSGEVMTASDVDGKSPFNLVSGSLEASRAEIGEEMVGVITAQRAFQMSAKLVQTADEIEEIVNNLR